MGKVYQFIGILIQVKEKPVCIFKTDVLVTAGCDNAAPGLIYAVIVMRGDYALQISACGVFRLLFVKEAEGGIVGALHPLGNRNSAQPQRGGGHVHMVYRHMVHISRLAGYHMSAPLFSADDKGNLYGFLVRCGLAELAVGAVHVSMVAEKQDVGVLHQARLVQAIHNPPHVPVNVFHHSVIPGQIPGSLLAYGGHRGNVGAEMDFRGKMALLVPRGSHIGIVRGLHRHNGEEGGLLLLLFPQVVDHKVGDGVRFIARQPEHGNLPVAPVAVQVTVVLGVVVFIPQPGGEPAAALPWHIVGAGPLLRLLGAVQVPFPQIEGVVPILPEDRGHGGLFRRKPVFVAGDTVVGVPAGQHGTPVRAAEREPGNGRGKVGACFGQGVQHRGRSVLTAIDAQAFCALLIGDNPKNIRSFCHDMLPIEPPPGNAPGRSGSPS